jgi:hypothetical protein
MNILSFFTNNGIPAIGLSPMVKIRDVLTGLLTISGANMSEIGDGFYNYDFAGYNYETDYAIVCDGGSTLADAERYVFAGNENYIDDIENVLDTNTTLSGIQEDLNNPDQYKADISALALETTVFGIGIELSRVLGLVQENYHLDQMTYITYQETNLLTSGRIRVYSDAISVGTDFNVIAIYNITASYDGDKLQTYKVVKQ